jgi:hypothetical protein
MSDNKNKLIIPAGTEIDLTRINGDLNTYTVPNTGTYIISTNTTTSNNISWYEQYSTFLPQEHSIFKEFVSIVKDKDTEVTLEMLEAYVDFLKTKQTKVSIFGMPYSNPASVHITLPEFLKSYHNKKFNDKLMEIIDDA